MIQLFEQDIKTDNRQSSKGNQLKWFNHEIWYKADYTGYEGMTEYIVSALLQKSTLDKTEYISYNTEQISYGDITYLGCSSKDFLPEGWKLITLERLFQNFCGESLYKSLYKIKDYEERLRFLVNQVVRITGLSDFGKYMSKLLTIDTFFLNEDRHTHNIAVLLDDVGNYRYCPVFDNGAALLSDTAMDYPMNTDIEILMGKVKAKTFCPDFDEQLDIAEQLYGIQINFHFTRKDVLNLVKEEGNYPEEVKQRIVDIVTDRIRKYQYLFHNPEKQIISRL